MVFFGMFSNFCYKTNGKSMIFATVTTVTRTVTTVTRVTPTFCYKTNGKPMILHFMTLKNRDKTVTPPKYAKNKKFCCIFFFILFLFLDCLCWFGVHALGRQAERQTDRQKWASRSSRSASRLSRLQNHWFSIGFIAKIEKWRNGRHGRHGPVTVLSRYSFLFTS